MAETQPTPSTRREVVDLCRDLIRIDTTNYGDDAGPGERKAAEYVAALLDEVGIETRLYESRPRADRRWSRAGAATGSDGTAAAARPPRRRAGRRRATGRSTRSPARSRTATSGAAAPST